MANPKTDEEAARRLMIFLCEGEAEAEASAKLILRNMTPEETAELKRVYRRADADAVAEARRRGFVVMTRTSSAPKPLTDEEVAEFDAFMQKVHDRLEKEEE